MFVFRFTFQFFPLKFNWPQVSIGSGNGLAWNRRQAAIVTDNGLVYALSHITLPGPVSDNQNSYGLAREL